nr:hypothetical protein [Tanacetum cinerariifolium]
MVECENHLKRKYQIMIDEEFAKNLEAQMQAELEEEDRLARLKEKETNIALVVEWDNTQAMMHADYIEITLVDESQGRMNEEDMFGVNDLDGDEVIVDVTAGENIEQSTKDAKKEVSTADPVTTTDEVVTTVEDVEVTTAATTSQIAKDDVHWLRA